MQSRWKLSSVWDVYSWVGGGASGAERVHRQRIWLEGYGGQGLGALSLVLNIPNLKRNYKWKQSEFSYPWVWRSSRLNTIHSRVIDPQ